jgi:hypothetical protein
VSEEDRLKAEIAATRAELAETADALAAKLDVKAQAGRKVHAAGEKVSGGYANLRGSAPPPVQKALGKTEQAVSPLLARAAADKRRTLAVLGGTVVVILVVRRVRSRLSSRIR